MPSMSPWSSPLSTGSLPKCWNVRSLSPFLRLYIYGIHGYFTEVMFTASWEFVVNTNWKFPGCTSVWSLFIYAGCGYVIEQMYLRLQGKVHILLRGVIYLLWTYTWEFSTGYVLRYFNACPWDYTLFDFNVVGLITLEYAPLWYLATLLQEQLLTKNILLLQWSPCAHLPACQCRQLDQQHRNSSADNGSSPSPPPQHGKLPSKTS